MFEDKPVDVEKTANLLQFEITVNKYGEYYDFTNSEEVVDDFLKNVSSRFKPSGLKLIKCSFVIENIQQSMSNLTPVLDTRYWTTDVYNTIYFNDFVFYGLRQNILSKVIVNGMPGSSWKFRRFIMLSLKVFNLDTEILK